jgi:drug/metabolite transporter (DMT)-like permease
MTKVRNLVVTPKVGRKDRMISLLMVLFCVILVVCGQLLLKYGMLRIGSIELNLEQLSMLLGKAVTSPLIISGLALYFISALAWLVVISKEELSFVQPLTASVYIFMVFFSWLLFKEEVGLIRILGVSAITLGVFLVARS